LQRGNRAWRCSSSRCRARGVRTGTHPVWWRAGRAARHGAAAHSGTPIAGVDGARRPRAARGPGRQAGTGSGTRQPNGSQRRGVGAPTPRATRGGSWSPVRRLTREGRTASDRGRRRRRDPKVGSRGPRDPGGRAARPLTGVDTRSTPGKPPPRGRWRRCRAGGSCDPVSSQTPQRRGGPAGGSRAAPLASRGWHASSKRRGMPPPSARALSARAETRDAVGLLRGRWCCWTAGGRGQLQG
jgi:hypothetical protein